MNFILFSRLATLLLGQMLRIRRITRTTLVLMILSFNALATLGLHDWLNQDNDPRKTRGFVNELQWR